MRDMRKNAFLTNRGTEEFPEAQVGDEVRGAHSQRRGTCCRGVRKDGSRGRSSQYSRARSAVTSNILRKWLRSAM